MRNLHHIFSSANFRHMYSNFSTRMEEEKNFTFFAYSPPPSTNCTQNDDLFLRCFRYFSARRWGANFANILRRPFFICVICYAILHFFCASCNPHGVNQTKVVRSCGRAESNNAKFAFSLHFYCTNWPWAVSNQVELRVATWMRADAAISRKSQAREIKLTAEYAAEE